MTQIREQTLKILAKLPDEKHGYERQLHFYT